MTNKDEAKSNQGTDRALRLYKEQNVLKYTQVEFSLSFSTFHLFDNKGTTKDNLKENYFIVFTFPKAILRK